MRDGERAFAPHCDPRILHAPGTCQHCDLYSDWQALRELWQIAFPGERVDVTAIVAGRREPVLPCPADYVRGDTHTKWHGNRASPSE